MPVLELLGDRIAHQHSVDRAALEEHLDRQEPLRFDLDVEIVALVREEVREEPALLVGLGGHRRLVGRIGGDERDDRTLDRVAFAVDHDSPGLARACRREDRRRRRDEKNRDQEHRTGEFLFELHGTPSFNVTGWTTRQNQDIGKPGRPKIGSYNRSFPALL
ncbi:MAG: hypothetical protein GTN89_17080 [Acidobacteria bacterium]|nr:hypothetical protein [Acidobacteriota bacterium]NIM64174.1 hypothetical protein [Acidobacteriota bacterium]NIO60996.1 hypothetical protein [Acidobacteriota bacterium]NIQ32009.1 hypothetical protein [Acidobacteriota bacterium]NIQ87505.1 hypothetical protein [Acidobacteriota bacterium]